MIERARRQRGRLQRHGASFKRPIQPPAIGLSRNRLGTRHLPRGTPREYPSGISTASTWNAKSTALWRPLAVRSSARIAHRQGGLRSASAPTQSRVRPIRLRPGDVFAAEPIFRSPDVLTVDRDVDRGDTSRASAHPSICSLPQTGSDSQLPSICGRSTTSCNGGSPAHSSVARASPGLSSRPFSVAESRSDPACRRSSESSTSDHSRPLNSSIAWASDGSSANARR